MPRFPPSARRIRSMPIPASSIPDASCAWRWATRTTASGSRAPVVLTSAEAQHFAPVYPGQRLATVGRIASGLAAQWQTLFRQRGVDERRRRRRWRSFRQVVDLRLCLSAVIVPVMHRRSRRTRGWHINACIRMQTARWCQQKNKIDRHVARASDTYRVGHGALQEGLARLEPNDRVRTSREQTSTASNSGRVRYCSERLPAPADARFAAFS